MRIGFLGTVAAAAVVLLSAASAAQAKPVFSVAIAVGNNEPHVDTAERLRFADDDAVDMYRLFEALPGEQHLLARFDRETEKRHSDLTNRAVAPTQEALEAALRDAAAKLTGASQQGWSTALYFFYAGHGGRKHFGEEKADLSYINLDSHLNNRALLRMLDNVPADVTHVLIDACGAVDFTEGRGDRHPDEPRRDLRAAIAGFLEQSSLKGRPDLGVVVSSTPQETALETPVLRGGIFTHVVRSGLLGGADLNNDRRIDYAELGAFADKALKSASEGDQRLIEVYIDPPRANPRAVLLDLERASARELIVPRGQQSRITIRDDGGDTYAEFHNDTAGGTNLLLLSSSTRYDIVKWAARSDTLYGEFRIEMGSYEPRSAVTLRLPAWRAPGTYDSQLTDRGLVLFYFDVEEDDASEMARRMRPQPRDAAAAAKADKERLLIFDPRLVGETEDPRLRRIAASIALAVNNQAARQIDQSKIEIMAEADIRSVINVEEIKQKLDNCESGDACFVEIAGALGDMDYLVHGRVDHLGGDAFQFEYAVMNLQTVASKGRVGGSSKGDRGAIVKAVTEQTKELFSFFPQAPPKPADLAPPGPAFERPRVEIVEGQRNPTLRVIGFTSIGLAAATGGAAVATLLLARQAQDDAANAGSFDDRQDALDRRDLFQNLTNGLTIAAAASAAVGAVFTTLYYATGSEAPVLAPYAAADGAGVGLHVEF